jgi:two-component system invasion response regulator UvrY
VRVLIVDDHPILVAGCQTLLMAKNIKVVTAPNAAAGFTAFFKRSPDVAIIDIKLPDCSGLELLRRILQGDPEANLVIFAISDDPLDAARALNEGAKGYITMKEQPARFLDAIKTVANGGRYLHPEMAHRIAFLRLDQSPDAVSNLSTRELEILRLMAAGRTMAQIADPLNVSYKTIANNVTELKRKLGATSGIDLMRMALSIREPKQLEVSKSSIRKRVDRNQARR